MLETEDEDSHSQPPRKSQEAGRLGRPPDTNCIRGLGSRRCGPCTWSNSPSGTAERWVGRRGHSDLASPPMPPLTLMVPGDPNCSEH